jgi:hypothetical protein
MIAELLRKAIYPYSGDETTRTIAPYHVEIYLRSPDLIGSKRDIEAPMAESGAVIAKRGIE